MFGGAGTSGGGAKPPKKDDDERASVANNANASRSSASAVSATAEHDDGRASSAHQGIISPSEAEEKKHPLEDLDLAETTELSPNDSASGEHELCTDVPEHKVQEKTEETSLPGVTPVSSSESSGAKSRSGNDAINFLDERIQRKMRIDQTSGRPKQATNDAGASQGALASFEDHIQRKIRGDATSPDPDRAPHLTFGDRVELADDAPPLPGTPNVGAASGQDTLTFEDRIQEKIGDATPPDRAPHFTFGDRVELVDDALPLPGDLDEGGGKKTGPRGNVEQVEDSGPEVSPQGAFQGKESIFQRDTKQAVEHADSSGSIEVPSERDDLHDAEAPQAAVPAGQTTPAPEPPDRPTYEAPFFAVEATLVDHHEEGQVYDATLIPEQSSLPWWKRTKTRKIGIALIGAGLIAAIVVSSVVSRDGADTEESTLSESVPVFPPPPFKCTVSDLGQMYESHCWTCVDIMDANDGMIAMSRDEDFVIRFVSNVGGNMSSTSQYRFDNLWPGAIATATGNVVAVGDAYEGDSYIGAVHMIEKDAAGVWNETQHIVPSNIEEEAEFGTSVDIDADVMAVGAPHDRDALGSAFVYRRTEGTWVQEAKLVPNALEQNFGSSVLVRENTIAVADNHYGDGSKGAVLVYTYNLPPSSPAWSLNETITNEGCDGSFGFSLAFSSDDGLLIGCPDESSGGAVYYYQRNESAFVLQQTIKSREAVNKFGYELATSGRYLAVGTYDAMDAKVFVFALHENVFEQVARINEPPTNQTNFGSNIVFSGNHILATTWENTYLHRLDCMDPDTGN